MYEVLTAEHWTKNLILTLSLNPSWKIVVALLLPSFNHEKVRLSKVSSFPGSPNWQVMNWGSR